MVVGSGLEFSNGSGNYTWKFCIHGHVRKVSNYIANRMEFFSEVVRPNLEIKVKLKANVRLARQSFNSKYLFDTALLVGLRTGQGSSGGGGHAVP